MLFRMVINMIFDFDRRIVGEELHVIAQCKIKIPVL